jgi:dTDP-4-dehydrorhamnose 3,5-epimerase
MKIVETRELAIPAVKVIRYARFADDRGWFTETFRAAQISEAVGGPAVEVAQANESRSKAGVVRGLHLQWNPWQGKLVRALRGRLIDVALDVRIGSPTFGKAVAHDLPGSAEDGEGEWIWLPPGFAHGALFPEGGTIEYLCTGAWSPGCEASISPFAADIDWTLCDGALRAEIVSLFLGDPLVTDKDRDGMTLADWVDSPGAKWFRYAEGEPWEIRREE